MRLLALSTRLLFSLPLLSQGPIVTSWIINPGGETGYGGFATNVQSVHYTASDAYVSATCIPGYDIGPWTQNPNLPANQDFCFRLTRNPIQNTGTLVNTPLGHIGVWRNGVSIFNAKDGMSYNNLGIWNRDARVFEGVSFDACLGHPAPNGEYHHHVSPNCLYDHMDEMQHSDLIGYAFDGFPIYGAHGFANADGSGGLTRMRSGYQLRSITERTTLPNGTALPANQYGPSIGGQYPLGAFLEDYVYTVGSGDLDAHNGRYCVTPDYPSGTYAYFVTLDAAYQAAFPYVLGPTYYGTVQSGNTGPGSGHNTIPGNAVLYDPSATSSITRTIASDNAAIFPNPAREIITVSSAEPMRFITISDALGRIVHMQQAGASRSSYFKVEGLVNGTYLVLVELSDGSMASSRFIKH
ncbi:MAG: YHYH protein [Flavobacteriales bacterium]|nr:YHYH protein [Flavobacteriales bacterium]